MYLGIDPGLKNLGLAITDKDGKLEFSKVYSLDDFSGQPEKLVEEIVDHIHEYDIEKAFMERYVAYAGRQTAITENLLMLIGGLYYALAREGLKPNMFRAIDWKPAICKYLFKVKDFRNPAEKFDKKFSMAAAECIIGTKPKTDHEADAICLSHIWKIYEQN
jgi:Holliday junction resolvasome RuvABC endonuclease subunit